jgi:hypothetical protein
MTACDKYFEVSRSSDFRNSLGWMTQREDTSNIVHSSHFAIRTPNCYLEYKLLLRILVNFGLYSHAVCILWHEKINHTINMSQLWFNVIHIPCKTEYSETSKTWRYIQTFMFNYNLNITKCHW